MAIWGSRMDRILMCPAHSRRHVCGFYVTTPRWIFYGRTYTTHERMSAAWSIRQRDFLWLAANWNPLWNSRISKSPLALPVQQAMVRSFIVWMATHR